MRRQMRTLFSALAVLAALVCLLYGVKSCTAKQEAQEAAAAQAVQDAKSVPTKSDSFVSIAYDNSITNLSFTKDEDGVWTWADDPEFPLDSKYMEELSATITSLNPMQTITAGDTLESYGLDNPSATITATAEDGSATVLLLGKALNDGSYYLKTADADIVYVVASTLHEQITRGVYDMAVLETFPALTAETLRTVSVEGPKATALTATSGEEDGSVVWTVEGKDVSAQTSVSTLTSELSALSFAACRDFNPSAKAVEICGLTRPAVVVTVDYVTDKGAEAQMVLSIGGNTPEADGRYARLNDSTTIYSITNESVASLLDIARNGVSAS